MRISTRSAATWIVLGLGALVVLGLGLWWLLSQALDNPESPTGSAADEEGSQGAQGPLPSGTPWGTFHGDSTRRGSFDLEGPGTTWTVPFQPNGSCSCGSSVVVADGILYGGAYDGSVYAIDIRDGAVVWRRPLGASVFASPTVSATSVYIGGAHTNDPYVYALDRADGSIRWRFKLGPVDGWVGAPVLSDGWVYVPAGGEVYALHEDDGRLLWHDQAWATELTIADGVVYVASHADDAKALDAKSGRQLWKVDLGMSSGSPLVLKSEVYFVADGRLVAVDRSSGAILWNFTADTPLGRAPAYANGTIFVSGQSYVYAVDATSGKQIWAFAHGYGVVSGPAVVDGVVYFSAGDLIAVKAGSGEILWRFRANAVTTPAIVDGIAYVNGNIAFYAVDIQNGRQHDSLA